MRKSPRLPIKKTLHAITMCYVLLIIPAVLVYGGMYFFTDMRGKELFNSFLPVALILLIFYIYYLIRPGRLFGSTNREWTELIDKDSLGNVHTETPGPRQSKKSDKQ